MSVALFSYSPYGQDNNHASQNPVLGFNGERYDLVARAYALGQGYRSYSTTLMRFQAPDTLSPFEQGGLNAYAFCEGDPINYRDPTGRMRLASLLQTPKKSFKRLISFFYRNRPGASQNKVLTSTLTGPITKTKKTIQFSNLPSRTTYIDESFLTRQEQFRYRADLIKHYERELMKNEPLLNEYAHLRKESTTLTFNRFKINTAYDERLRLLGDTKRRFDHLSVAISKTRSI